MPLWLVIMVAGAAGTGFLFLKAREIERAAPYKKIRRGNLTVKKAAKAVAARPSTLAVHEPLTSTEPVHMSKDLSTRVAEDIEEVMSKKGI